MKKLFLIVSLFVLTVTATSAALVIVNWIEPANVVAAGGKNYRLLARSLDGLQQQWLGDPPLATTQTEFESSVATAKCGDPCMIAMLTLATNGTNSVSSDWIVFTTVPPVTNAPPPVVTNAPPLLPPSAVTYRLK